MTVVVSTMVFLAATLKPRVLAFLVIVLLAMEPYFGPAILALLAMGIFSAWSIMSAMALGISGLSDGHAPSNDFNIASGILLLDRAFMVSVTSGIVFIVLSAISNIPVVSALP